MYVIRCDRLRKQQMATFIKTWICCPLYLFLYFLLAYLSPELFINIWIQAILGTIVYLTAMSYSIYFPKFRVIKKLIHLLILRATNPLIILESVCFPLSFTSSFMHCGFSKRFNRLWKSKHELMNFFLWIFFLLCSLILLYQWTCYS